MFFMASVAKVSNPTLLQSKSPTTQTMHMPVSTATVPYFFSSSTISSRWVALSMLMLTPTSEVAIMSMGVW